jgi:hypothetical protein
MVNVACPTRSHKVTFTALSATLRRCDPPDQVVQSVDTQRAVIDDSEIIREIAVERRRIVEAILVLERLARTKLPRRKTLAGIQRVRSAQPAKGPDSGPDDDALPQAGVRVRNKPRPPFLPNAVAVAVSWNDSE